jgi:hypothetical protein
MSGQKKNLPSDKNSPKENISKMLKRIRHENEALKHLITALRSHPDLNEKTK